MAKDDIVCRLIEVADRARGAELHVEQDDLDQLHLAIMTLPATSLPDVLARATVLCEFVMRAGADGPMQVLARTLLVDIGRLAAKRLAH